MPLPSLLVAFGGNALNDPSNARPHQREEFLLAERAMNQVADLVEQGYRRLILTHGNGPQVGQIFLQQELTEHQIQRHVTLDVCVADSQGRIGYILQNVFDNVCSRRGLNRTSSSIITQVVVDAADPAFRNPTKPIGMFYSEEEAERLRREKDWVLHPDAEGRGHRRVVPSPRPVEIVELPLFERLLREEVIVIGAGGGGIPVVRRASGQLEGVEAVIDKDRTSALLAACLQVDLLVILTRVDGVYLHFNTPRAERIGQATAEAMSRWLKAGQFGEGSMAPKVEAAVRFVQSGGGRAVIAGLGQLSEAVAGKAGTQILP